MRTLIIGIGNPVRGDDGLGWKIADQLSRELSSGLSCYGVRVLAAHQLTPELAEFASHADRVLFVDAAQNGEPGSLQCHRIAPDAPAPRHSHALSPAALLGMTESLYGRCPEACLLTLAGESFSVGESLSAKASAALPALRAQIQRFIESESWDDLVTT